MQRIVAPFVAVTSKQSVRGSRVFCPMRCQPGLLIHELLSVADLGGNLSPAV